MFTDHQPVAAGRRQETHHASTFAELLDREILPRLERPGRFVATTGIRGLDIEPAGAPRPVFLWPSEPGVPARPPALESYSSALFAQSGKAPNFACLPPVELGEQLRTRGLRPFAHDSWEPLDSYGVWIFVLEDPAQLLGACTLLHLSGLSPLAGARGEDAPLILMLGPALRGLDLARAFADLVLEGEAGDCAGQIHELLSAGDPRPKLKKLSGRGPLPATGSFPEEIDGGSQGEARDRGAATLLPVHPAALARDPLGWDRDAGGRPRRLVQPWAATETLRRSLGLAGDGEDIWAAFDELSDQDDLAVLLRFAVGSALESEEDRQAIVGRAAEALRRSGLEPGRLTVQLIPFIEEDALGSEPEALGGSIERVQTRLRKLRCRVETGEPVVPWRGSLLRQLGVEATPLLFEMLRRGARAAESPLACDADLWHKALQAVNLDGRLLEMAVPSPQRAAGSSCPEPPDRAARAPSDQRRETDVRAEPGGSGHSVVRGTRTAGGKHPAPRQDRWKRWAELAPRHFDYRLEFSKCGRWRHLSQRELSQLFLDICQRADVPLATTGVAQRRARMSFGPSLQVGVEGLREYIDLSLTRKHPRLESVLRPWLPRKLELLSVQFRPAGSARLGLGEIARASYEAFLPLGSDGSVSMTALRERRDELMQQARRARLVLATGGNSRPDAIHQLVHLDVDEPSADGSMARLSFTLDLECEGKKLRVLELIDRLLNGLVDEPHLLPIRRTRLLAATSDGDDWITPREQIERHRRELRARAKCCA